MKLHVLVEGVSDQVFLTHWLPRIIPGHTFRIYPHEGKGKLAAEIDRKPDPKHRGLLDLLPAKLRAFGKTLDPSTERVVVIVDLDQQDCHDLKKRLLKVLDHCEPKPVVIFRIAIRETEVFFLGDPQAIRKAYPKAKIKKNALLDPDSLENPSVYLKQVLNERIEIEDKIEWADRIGRYLSTNYEGKQRNQSSSFQHLCKGLLRICGEIGDE